MNEVSRVKCFFLQMVLLSMLLSPVLLPHTISGEPPVRLLFQAGAGHRAALDEIAEVFQRHHPDLRVDFQYNRSGYFLKNMARSKKGDLYMPGGEFYLLQAQNRGFLKDYHPETDIAAWFIPVIITPDGNPKNIRSIADFTVPGVRVGLGDSIEACSIGRWHEKIFNKAGIWDNVRKNTTVRAICISELCNACRQKEIDATIVWTNAAILFLKEIDIVPLAPEYRTAIKLPAAVLSFSGHPEKAKSFRDFILSDKGKTIFHRHAYCIDPGKADQDIQWLVAANRAVKDPSLPVTEKTVGPFVNEVTRLRRTGDERTTTDTGFPRSRLR
jgi:molybdate transport system substrate-binding protein